MRRPLEDDRLRSSDLRFRRSLIGETDSFRLFDALPLSSTALLVGSVNPRPSPTVLCGRVPDTPDDNEDILSSSESDRRLFVDLAQSANDDVGLGVVRGVGKNVDGRVSGSGAGRVAKSCGYVSERLYEKIVGRLTSRIDFGSSSLALPLAASDAAFLSDLSPFLNSCFSPLPRRSIFSVVAAADSLGAGDAGVGRAGKG